MASLGDWLQVHGLRGGSRRRHRTIRSRSPKESWVSQELSNAVDRLEEINSEVSSSIYASLLRKCSEERAFSYGRRVHAHLVSTNYVHNTFLSNLLVQMYGQCGKLDWARDAFDHMQKRNAYSWNVLIDIYMQRGLYYRAFESFRRMQFEGGRPDSATYTSIIRACGNLKYLAQGKAIHYEIIDRRIEQDHLLQTALVYMYGRCKRLRTALMVFRDIRLKEAVAWNTVIAAFAQHGHYTTSLYLYRRMLWEGVEPDSGTYSCILGVCTSMGNVAEARAVAERVVAERFDQKDVSVQNALVNMYAKCGEVKEARNVLERMPKRIVTPWNLCISAYVQQSRASESLQLYHAMKAKGVRQNACTFASILDACSGPEGLPEGRAIHARIISRKLLPNAVIETALLKMYANCGSLADARVVFDRMEQRSVVSWNAMIAAYAQHGYNKESLELFERMEKEDVKPNGITFSSIFGACSNEENIRKGEEVHAGIVARGLELSVATENAILDMYRKCGRVEDAKRTFDRMERRNVGTWEALISAYAESGHVWNIPALFQAMELEGLEQHHGSTSDIAELLECQST